MHPAKQNKTHHGSTDTAKFSKSGMNYFCHNGCGSNKTHATKDCIMCGKCKAKAHCANNCNQEVRKTASTSKDNATDQRQGGQGSYMKGRHHGNKTYQRGNYQGLGVNTQNSVNK
ncbi:hypothetical protein BGZ76_003031, partial [Entomortierella beljakovae]